MLTLSLKDLISRWCKLTRPRRNLHGGGNMQEKRKTTLLPLNDISGLPDNNENPWLKKPSKEQKLPKVGNLAKPTQPPPVCWTRKTILSVILSTQKHVSYDNFVHLSKVCWDFFLQWLSFYEREGARVHWERVLRCCQAQATAIHPDIDIYSRFQWHYRILRLKVGCFQ